MLNTQRLLESNSPNTLDESFLRSSSLHALSSSVEALSSDVLSGLSYRSSISFSRSSSSSSASLTGTLDGSDPTNPTRAGTFGDDYFLTDVVAGQQVQVNLNSRAFDTYLQVINAETGQVLEFDDNSGQGSNARVTFTVADGIDYIVRATSSESDVTGNYTLRTSTGVAIPGTPISSNETLNGTLSTTDPNNPNRPGKYYDGYLLTGLSVGQTVQVNLDSSAFDTYLQVVNADTGAVLAYDDDSGSGYNSQLNFTVQDGIDYIVRATSYSSGVTGAYTLTTQTLTLPDGYNPNYGYGLVNAAAAVADAIGQSPFPDVPNLGGNNWGLDMVNAPEAWDQGYTGQGVVVAVLDTGVDYNHSDLNGNIWVNSGEIAGNSIDDDGNGFVDDVRGWDFVSDDNDPMDMDIHGTHVAGTIAAENNGFGVTGVAYDATIMPVRVIGDWDEQDNYEYLEDIAAGIYYAVDNGANVINMSLGYDPSWYGGSLPPEAQLVEDAIQYAAEQGTIVVMAAGNDSASQPGYPAYYASDWGIAVGAVSSTNTMASFSDRAGTTPLDYVVAPGVSVYSTKPGNTYQYLSGTSMAAPHVAGVAALILSANPNLTAEEVESIITQTANPTGITV